MRKSGYFVSESPPQLQRDAYTVEQLATAFREANKAIEERKWCILIAAYTGMLLKEITQFYQGSGIRPYPTPLKYIRADGKYE